MIVYVACASALVGGSVTLHLDFPLASEKTCMDMITVIILQDQAYGYIPVTMVAG